MAETRRLAEANNGQADWRRWGPYLPERQWGTVREDYSPHGNAWEYLPHDHARSRAYRWGEDGLAGISDDQQRLCLSLALWNGHDPILKERLFGLTNSEGNHGEDVKELYSYLDATPSHSCLKMLYKYPQQEFPYGWLVEENRRRGKDQPEFELLDTGIFDGNRYFDVFVEYAKAGSDDLLMLVTVHNRGPEQATIHVLPQIWFRNTWSWQTNSTKPLLVALSDSVVEARQRELGEFRLCCQHGAELLCCENETNPRRLYGQSTAQGYFKDAFHEFIVGGDKGAVNSNRTGTKAGALYRLLVAPGSSATVRLRLSKEPAGDAAKIPSNAHGNGADKTAFAGFDSIMATCRREADEFYAELQQDTADPDARVHELEAVGLTVSDLDREVRFFTDVLAFKVVSHWEAKGQAVDDLVDLPKVQLRTAELGLGAERITLTEHLANKGHPIPSDSRSYDHWFQRIAIVVSDMDRAYEHLRRHKVKHVSTAPQTLPDWNKNAAGIRAFYFRDPEEHVLEVIWFPPGKGDPRWEQKTERLFLGIDHTAIVASDTGTSLAFYRELLGMRVTGESKNYGVEQEHINQVFGARLRITSLCAASGPGIEFLEYLAPPGGRNLPDNAKASDLSFWRTDLRAKGLDSLASALRVRGARFVSKAVVTGADPPPDSARRLIVRDPDGHAMQFTEESPAIARSAQP